MSSYELNIRGQKPIIITEQEKQSVTAYWKPGGRSTLLHIAGSEIDTSSIVSLHKLDDTTGKIIDANAEKYAEQNRDFIEDCRRIAALTPYEKMKKEATVRIMPGIKLSGATLPDEIKKKLMNELLAFFTDNPRFPRCPMRVWWPIITPFIRTTAGTRWWNFIATNDAAITRYLNPPLETRLSPR